MEVASIKRPILRGGRIMWNYNYVYVDGVVFGDELEHHGIKGQKWFHRRWQNKDGSLTPAGKKRYAKLEKREAKLQKKKEAIAGKGKDNKGDSVDKPHSDYKKARGNVKKMSDKEVQAASQRLENEKKIKNNLKELDKKKEGAIERNLKKYRDKAIDDASAYLYNKAKSKLSAAIDASDKKKKEAENAAKAAEEEKIVQEKKEQFARDVQMQREAIKYGAQVAMWAYMQREAAKENQPKALPGPGEGSGSYSKSFKGDVDARKKARDAYKGYMQTEQKTLALPAPKETPKPASQSKAEVKPEPQKQTPKSGLQKASEASKKPTNKYDPYDVSDGLNEKLLKANQKKLDKSRKKNK